MSASKLDPNEPEVWQNLLRQLDDKKQDNKAAARLSELSIAMGSHMGFTFSKTSHKKLLAKEVSCYIWLLCCLT
jgi:hypothetical protein